MTRSSRPFHDISPSRPAFTLIEVLVVLGILAVLFAVFMPPVRRGREPARRTQCRNNLKQFGLALHNYHDTYGAFPPAYTVDAEGKRLHSWRTLLLPYLDQKALYDRIDLSKAWDDPANAEPFKATVLGYGCPSATSPNTLTTYLAVVTPQSCLRPEASCSIKEITDGTSNTIMLIEVDTEHAVPWMAPNDADEALLLSLGPKSKLSHSGGWHALFGDGAVRWLNADTSAADRLALVSVAVKDKVSKEP